jgi:hypothetical protein
LKPSNVSVGVATPDQHRFMSQVVHYFRAKMKGAKITLWFLGLKA